jgi:hypothetical protein
MTYIDILLDAGLHQETRDCKEFMAPKRIAPMDLMQLTGGLLYNHARFCALNPSVDCSMALLVVITFRKDDDGSCTQKLGELVKLLSRSEREILAAYKRLEAQGFITIDPRSDSDATVTSRVRNRVH